MKKATLESKFSDLMKKSQNGDQNAYKELLTRVGKYVGSYISPKLVKKELADEVVQEILFSLHLAQRTYHPDRPFLPWINAIARNQLVDHFRKWARVPEHYPDDNVEISEIAHQAQEKESGLTDELANAIKKLTKKQRAVVTLLKIRGLSISETASQMNMTESAVKVTAHRAYKALRKRFGVDTYENK